MKVAKKVKTKKNEFNEVLVWNWSLKRWELRSL